jgi:predicted ribosome quality control (RQC) complex YloA/Tae2 family protein
VRRAAKTKLQFLERRLLRQKQDLPPAAEIENLERRAEGMRANLYMWPKDSSTWYVPREVIESHGLPAMLTLKSGERPGDVLARAFHEVDRIKRRRDELLVRLAESTKSHDDFVALILSAGAEITELRERLGLEGAVSTAAKAGLEAKVALNLPSSAGRLLRMLEMEWTEGSQRTREMEEEKARRLPYRSYEASSGEFIRVAKSASDGDSMLRLMPSHHTWVHVMTGEGSHVWLEKPKKAKPSHQAVREAAILAIHHSRQSRAMEAEVYVSLRADIEKRKDLAPGKVIVRKAGSLLVRYEDEELQKVLSTYQTT